MSIQTIAKRNTDEEVIQANFRLPKSLLDELKKVSETQSVSMTVIVDQAIRTKLSEIQNGSELISINS